MNSNHKWNIQQKMDFGPSVLFNAHSNFFSHDTTQRCHLKWSVPYISWNLFVCVLFMEVFFWVLNNIWKWKYEKSLLYNITIQFVLTYKRYFIHHIWKTSATLMIQWDFIFRFNYFKCFSISQVALEVFSSYKDRSQAVAISK